VLKGRLGIVIRRERSRGTPGKESGEGEGGKDSRSVPGVPPSSLLQAIDGRTEFPKDAWTEGC